VGARATVGLLLGMARLGAAMQIWAVWDLDLGGYAPPSHFPLTVSSPTGTPVPQAMTVPWGACTTVPGARHCAPIGCPPTGTHVFAVRAQYADGMSDPSNAFTCTIMGNACQCA